MDGLYFDFMQPEGSHQLVKEEIANTLYWCPSCKKVYGSVKCFNNHVNNHHNPAEFEGKLFPVETRETVTKHKWIYENGAEVVNYQCQKCTFNATTPYSIIRHLRISPELTLTCVQLCPDGVPIPEKVGEIFLCPLIYLCPTCGKTYSSSNSLKYHMGSCPEDQEKTFRCEVCGAAFTDMGRLKGHWKIHDVQRKRYVCESCGNVYFWASSLRHHVAVHHRTIEKHPCPICGKVFWPKGILHKHMRRVHDANRQTFSCDQCGQKFVTKYNLSVHQRIHNGTKPYQCTLCDAAFAQKSSLNGHMRKHGVEIQKPRKQIECAETLSSQEVQSSSVPYQRIQGL